MIRKGKFNVVVDGQWGSCGKGLINTALADLCRPAVVSSTNMANAGHTCIVDGEKFVAKILPTSAILSKKRVGYTPYVFIGPSAAFRAEQLNEEINICGVRSKLLIHPRAGIIRDEHRERETSSQTGTKHIASTMQGCGAMLSDKIMRRPTVRLAGQTFPEFGMHPELREALGSDSFAMLVNSLLENGGTILHEGSQGFSLGINHGSHYPQCTSRECTAMQMAADMGVAPQNMGEVIMVIRPYPIRVGNVVEDGEEVGNSGGCYDDQEEVSWTYVAEQAGAPVEVTKGELTTVTKRLRRVFTFSMQQLRQAAKINGATQIALNFANYLDWRCFGKSNWDTVRFAYPKIDRFIEDIEAVTGIPVTLIGTGPDNSHVAFDYRSPALPPNPRILEWANNISPN